IGCFLGFTVLITSGLAVDSSLDSRAKSADFTASSRAPGSQLSRIDSDTASGFSHLYSLQYDKSIADFEHTLKHYPTDPFAVNHLLQAILLKEMYRLNALVTTLYTD